MFAVTPDGVYERLRAILREGVIPKARGRGSHGGVRATPTSVAALLIAILASERLREAGKSCAKIAKLKSENGKCKLTGCDGFLEGVATLLANPALLSRVVELAVSRKYPRSYIRYRKTRGKTRSNFGISHDEIPEEDDLKTISERRLTRVAELLNS